MKTKQKNPELTKKYEELTAKIESELKEFRTYLKKHNKNQKSDPENWGYLGDLGRCHQLLRELNRKEG